MKIHTLIFILGLLVFVTPIIGFPKIYEQIILAFFGLAVMILISFCRGNINQNSNLKEEVFKESIPEDKIETEPEQKYYDQEKVS